MYPKPLYSLAVNGYHLDGIITHGPYGEVFKASKGAFHYTIKKISVFEVRKDISCSMFRCLPSHIYF